MTAWKDTDENLTAAQRIQWLAENPDICEIILTAAEAKSLWGDRVFAGNRIVELERQVSDLTEPRQATADSTPRFKEHLAPISEMLRGSGGTTRRCESGHLFRLRTCPDCVRVMPKCPGCGRVARGRVCVCGVARSLRG